MTNSAVTEVRSAILCGSIINNSDFLKMNFMDELIRAFDRSLIISCWKYIFPLLVLLYLSIFLYDRHRYGGKKKEENSGTATATANAVKEKLDGMEYVGGKANVFNFCRFVNMYVIHCP